jgi:hypothetical protein
MHASSTWEKSSCGICSRRSVVFGAVATTVSYQFRCAADSAAALPCACTNDEFANRHRTKSSKSGDDNFDAALVSELENIEKVIPGIKPGFQFIDANNAFTTSEIVIRGTASTVWIGKTLVSSLAKASFDGGIAVASVLAHECTHAYQLNNASLLTALLENRSTGLLAELHADFLSGYYLAHKRNVMQPESLLTVERIYNYPGAYDRRAPQYHGSPGLRAAALETGFFTAKDGSNFIDASWIGAKYVRGLA